MMHALAALFFSLVTFAAFAVTALTLLEDRARILGALAMTSPTRQPAPAYARRVRPAAGRPMALQPERSREAA